MNCFQKLLSSWWRTTIAQFIDNLPELWIAFKNYYLRDEGQLGLTPDQWETSCELLSKIIIFVMKDNEKVKETTFVHVVNCFQKLLSSWWRTTFLHPETLNLLLWIAFKNYYLRDEGQLFAFLKLCRFSCELLSKIIIFVMKDNEDLQYLNLLIVVNCFQKLLSSWWRTTD